MLVYNKKYIKKTTYLVSSPCWPLVAHLSSDVALNIQLVNRINKKTKKNTYLGLETHLEPRISHVTLHANTNWAQLAAS
jgi:hypothetical protein